MKKPTITYADFEKLDIRIGKILHAENVENSKKLLALTIDLGEDYGTVEILSGIQQFTTPEGLIGRSFPILANLEPRPMAGKISNGMVLMIDSDIEPIFIDIGEQIKVGSEIR
ncbi:methionine--tRNA ligase [Candidatus Roizmanbacteria bacterium]|nr:methionine--tRNA ligase [Candidatus Roizmanbacteria bacterium]